MDEYDITNVYMAYLDNEPMIYPSLDEHTILAINNNKRDIPTGWHILPNLLWRHFCKPKQWYNMLVNYESYAIKGMQFTLFNSIPITNNLSIQRTSLFAAFNNCIYANTYTDKFYETSWHPWYEQSGSQRDNLNLLYKEGVFYTGTSTSTTDTSGYSIQLYKFPQYYWRRQYVVTEFNNMWSQGKEGSAGVFDTYNAAAQQQQPIPAGLVWDPYERPEDIGELRAGKNAVTFEWEPMPCDYNKEFLLDRIMEYSTWTSAGPYIGSQRIGTAKKFKDMDPETVMTYGAHARNTETISNLPEDSGRPVQIYEDYSIPNWSFCPIVPNVWAWHEIKNSIADIKLDKAYQKIDKYWCGTEGEQYKYPPYQMFVKGIPIYDASNSLIRTSTQISVKVTLKLQCRKRRSAYFCPTWGPFSGDQLYYHNPHKLIYQENYIRYKTAGVRRTWQNINRFSIDSSKKVHGREDAYSLSASQNEIAGSWYDASTYPVPTTSGKGGLRAKDADSNRIPEIQITLEKGGKSTVRYKPTAQPRQKTPSPEKYADMQLMEHMDTHI
nr:MAG: capsid protein [Duck parvovirus]